MTTLVETTVPAAQYLRMSTEHQNYSLENQRAAIKRYAEQRGFAVIKTYADFGKSGLVLKHREGLAQLLHDVVGTKQPYRAVLVYDVSRWGRFQDTDEAAYYEFHCKRAGVPVYYCAETFANDGTMSSLVMKALKRVMAGEYSRELSEKVFAGMKGMILRGLWAGSMPGYGLRRMLVSSEGKPKHVMKFGDRKNLRSDRTILVPGPSGEIKWIHEIYRLFIEDKRSAVYIAKVLNLHNVRNGHRLWNNQSVLEILKNEKYTGSLVWGRWTQKLHTRTVPVAKEKWTVLPGALKAIVDRQTYDAAQMILQERCQNKSNEALLKDVRSFLFKNKKITEDILNRCRTVPSAGCCRHRFGSLKKMYALLGYKQVDPLRLRKKTLSLLNHLHVQLFRRLRELFPDLSLAQKTPTTRPKTFRVSSGLMLSVVVCLSERTALGSLRWMFNGVAARRCGFVTLLCRCNSTNTGIRDFYVMPSVRHINIMATLTEDDVRLESGVRLKRLREFREVALSM